MDFFKKYPAVLPWSLLIFVVVTIFFWPESKANKLNKEIEKSKEDAFFAAQRIIEQELKSPTTAKFGSITDCGLPLIDYQAGTWSAECFVDAQNNFGATIRTHYHVTLKRDGQTWHKVDEKIW